MGSDFKSGRRRSNNAVTISDVAERAGVSPMTVSNVLSGTRHVFPAKREAVLDAVRELNYRPNRAARSLASAELARVGLLYGNPMNEFLSKVLVGVLEATDRLGSQLTIRKVDTWTPVVLRGAVDRLIDEGVNGLLVPAWLCDVFTEFDSGRVQIPFVGIAPGIPSAHFPSVRGDEHLAAFEMTELLIELGHRRIGFIEGPVEHSASSVRLAGFQAALVAHGMEPGDMPVARGDFSYQSGLVAGAMLLDSPSPPTAVFASNDMMAAGVISLAHQRHLDVPGDLAIVGFDDAPISTQIWPELTTVRLPIAEMASRALEMVVGNLRAKPESDPASINDVVFRHEIVVRQSSGESILHNRPG